MDVVEILKLGLPGLVFLLSVLSYRLLSKEQNKETPSQPILKSIRQYMYVNILLALLTVAAPILDSFYLDNDEVFNLEAKLSGTHLEAGKAAVCEDAKYSGRYLLITDTVTMKMVQVYAMGILPCTDGEIIALGKVEANKLGWDNNSAPMIVEIAAASKGQKYILGES